MKPLLSILIPTVVGREEQLSVLMSKFGRESGIEFFPNCDMRIEFKNQPLEIIVSKDNKEKPIGQKREELYQAANGLFSWQIDDDDSIAPNAIELILEAIKSNPEIPCITFRERCMMNGVYQTSNHSIIYDCWRDNWDGYNYTRSPFYKDVIRTDIAQSVQFERIRYNEDEKWSMAIKPLLTNEIHIDEELYYYSYEPKESHNERYGITQ